MGGTGRQADWHETELGSQGRGDTAALTLWLWTPAWWQSSGMLSSNGSSGPHDRCKKLCRPVCISRRAGMQGKDPMKAFCKIYPVFSRNRLYFLEEKGM